MQSGTAISSDHMTETNKSLSKMSGAAQNYITVANNRQMQADTDENDDSQSDTLDHHESFYHNAIMEDGRSSGYSTEMSMPSQETQNLDSASWESQPQATNPSVQPNNPEGMSTSSVPDTRVDHSRQLMVGHSFDLMLTNRLNYPEDIATKTESYQYEKDDLPKFDTADDIIEFLFDAQSRMVPVQPILLQVSGLAKCGKTTALIKSLKLPEPERESRFLVHELLLSGKKAGLRDRVKTLLSLPYQSYMYGIKAGMPQGYKFPDHIIQEIEASIKRRLPPNSDPTLINFIKDTVSKLHKPIITAVTPGKVGLRSYTNEELLSNESLRMKTEKVKIFENKLRNGVGLCNIWDIDVTETAISSFIESFGLSFTQKYMLLFIDLERDVDKLEYPPEDIPHDSMTEPLRPRLQYLFRNCQMTKRDKDTPKKICRIFAKFTHGFKTKVRECVLKLKKECKNAARQMGVEDIVDFHVIEVEFEVVANNTGNQLEPTHESKKEIKHLLDFIWKEQAKKKEIPISWFLLIGWLVSRKAFYINRNKLERLADIIGLIKTDSTNPDYAFEEFCRFFTSFGSIIDVSQIDKNKTQKYIITKPLEFLKCYKNLVSSPKSKVDASGVIAVQNVTPDEKVVLEAMVSAGLASILPNSQDYYLPSFRKNLPTNKYFNSEAVQLSLSISSPRVNLQIEILKQLLHQSDIEVLFSKSKFLNVVVIRKGVVEITLTSQGTVLEIYLHDTEKNRSLPVLKSCCIDLAKVIRGIVEKKSKDFDIKIKYQYAILCKRGDQSLAGTAFNAYRLQHVLPTSLYCATCRKDGARGKESQYDETLEAWNYTLNKPEVSVPEGHKDGELYPQTIVEISMEIAEKDHWESVKFLAEKLKGKISIVAPEKHERQWYIMQMLIEWVHIASVQEDESLSKLLARKLIQCHEEKGNIVFSAYQLKDLTKEKMKKIVPNFKALARKVDMQVLTAKQRQKIIEGSYRGGLELANCDDAELSPSAGSPRQDPPQAFNN